jgi:methionyl-tRNA formyltransferase
LADGTIEEKEQDNRQPINDDRLSTTDDRQPIQNEVPSPGEHWPSVIAARSSSLRHAPKIFTDTCRIDWNKPVDEVHNLVRGLSPFPGAFTTLQGKMLKIYRSEKDHTPPALLPGEVQTDHRSLLKFTCTDGHLVVKELQLEGKKKMPVEEFLKGYRG